jgi:hypothetical protein
VRARRLLAAELAGALVDHVHAEGFPGQLGRIPFGEYFDALAVDEEVATVHAHRACETPVRGVEAGQVRIGLRVAEVVDGDDFELVGASVLVHGPHDVAADAAVTVNCDFDCHFLILR